MDGIVFAEYLTILIGDSTTVDIFDNGSKLSYEFDNDKDVSDSGNLDILNHFLKDLLFKN